MQDSLEDYIRISKNQKKEAPRKVSPKVLITAQRKKECEARAMKIVEFLIEGKLRKEAFFECLKHIDPSQYQDIVEERAITNLCGYCLCNKKIPEMPKQQYHISTKVNKVYDITDRKHYCSNICYKSSIHIKGQIETSPLWLRKLEDAPKFQLLPSCERGVPGEEIDHGIAKPVKDDAVFTPVCSFTEASLEEAIEDEIRKDNKKKRDKSRCLQSSMLTIAEDDEQKVGDVQSITENKKEKELKSDPNLAEKPEKSPDKTAKITKKAAKVDVLAQIQIYVKEWVTLETLVFLHGEDKIKSILNEATLADYFDRLKVADLQASQQVKYLNICRKLKLKELAEEKFDQSVHGAKLKPIPDYKQLKEESKTLDLKVKAFYSGTLHEQDDTNFPTVKKDGTEEEAELVLPLVDTNSQNALRKKIYLDSVNRTMQKLLVLLDLHGGAVAEDLQALVKTFNLQAHNTVFKPLVWNIIGVVLLKMLGVKREDLKTKLEEEKSQKYVKLLLKPFPNNSGFIENILQTLSDVEGFVEYHVTAHNQR